MSLWDVQRDSRDSRIIAIRPAGFKGWGRRDGLAPLSIKQEELGTSYFDLDAISASKGGDGIAKTTKILLAEEQVKAIPDADILAEVKARGLSAVIDDAIKEVG